MTDRLPHGTTISSAGGRLREAHDRHGNETWSVRWNGDALHTIRLRRPDRTVLELDGSTEPHPLFHRAHSIRWEGRPVARCGGTRWLDPETIPPVDVPAAIPAGGGSALLNWLAWSASRADVDALRYRGPYPTAALFDALLQSFTVEQPAAALSRFTANVESRAIRGAMTEVDVPFAPAPFEWHWPSPELCVQLRDGVERLFIAGRGYALHQRGSRRLRREHERTVAYVEIAGIAWHDVLTVDAEGTPVGEPSPLPPAPERLVGRGLPPEIVELLAAVLRQRAPTMLEPAIAALFESHELRWGDTGDDAARAREDAIELHSVLGERVPDLDPTVMLEAFVDALEPVVTRLAQRRLAL